MSVPAAYALLTAAGELLAEAGALLGEVAVPAAMSGSDIALGADTGPIETVLAQGFSEISQASGYLAQASNDIASISLQGLDPADAANIEAQITSLNGEARTYAGQQAGLANALNGVQGAMNAAENVALVYIAEAGSIVNLCLTAGSDALQSLADLPAAIYDWFVSGGDVGPIYDVYDQITSAQDALASAWSQAQADGATVVALAQDGYDQGATMVAQALGDFIEEIEDSTFFYGS